MRTPKMHLSALRFGIAGLLMLVASVALGQGDSSALKMVQTLRLGDNLADLSYQFAKTTTTYRGVEATLGPKKADELLQAELAVVVPKHQDEWNRNLAQAWAPLMAPQEFDSVVSEKQRSPFAPKFLSLQDRAGAAMKARSEPLLKRVLTEVLTGFFEKSMREK